MKKGRKRRKKSGRGVTRTYQTSSVKSVCRGCGKRFPSRAEDSLETLCNACERKHYPSDRG